MRCFVKLHLPIFLQTLAAMIHHDGQLWRDLDTHGVWFLALQGEDFLHQLLRDAQDAAQ